MSMRLYLKNGAPAGSIPRAASQPKTPGWRSAIAPIVCMVTSPAIATYGCSARSTILGAIGMSPCDRVD
jgi:hypothetical protein